MSSTPIQTALNTKAKRLAQPFFVRVGPNDEDLKALTDVVDITHGPSAEATAEDFEKDWDTCFEFVRVIEDYNVDDIWARMLDLGWIGDVLNIATDVEY